MTRDDLTRDEAEQVAAAVLELLRPVLHVAILDAYSDFRDDLPPSVAAAQAWLRERGRQQGRDPALGVRIDVRDDEGWAVVVAYAAWSIDAEFFDASGDLLAWLHDCCWSVTADLTETEADALGAQLAEVRPVRPLPDRRRRSWRS